MKKTVLILWALSACFFTFSQSPTKHVSILPSYPLVTGENLLYDNATFTNNTLVPVDVMLDSLPRYEIGHILPQHVYYVEDGIGFYTTADSLHANNVVFHYAIDTIPTGTIEFDTISGRFKFYPHVNDYINFTVTFTATASHGSISQEVVFTMMPSIIPEAFAFESQGVMPSPYEYTTLAQTSTSMYLNNQTREAWSISISGKDIVFDNNLQNKVWGLSGRNDLYELNIYAERIYIRSALHFPQTHITIHARELIFEDNQEIASINTSPIHIVEYSNETGIDGGNAGDITLHIKQLTADHAKRFILNGGKGQSVNRNGTPGNGGNGGVFSSASNIFSYCDLVRGSAGVKFDADNDSTLHGAIIGTGREGETGYVQIIDEEYSWLHPYVITAVVRYINDSYLNLYDAYSKFTCNEYARFIGELKGSGEWNEADEITKMEIENLKMEIESMLFRLNNDLDYFGNPTGWTPMLSFEILLENYNNEIDRAIPTLYLNYWLNHVDGTLAQWIAASIEAAGKAEIDLYANQELLNKLIFTIPILENKVTELITMMDDLTNKMERKKNQLLSKAKSNVKKRNRINKAFGILKGVSNALPVLGGVGAAVSVGLNRALDFAGNYFGIYDSYGYGNAINNAFNSFLNFDFSANLNTLVSSISAIDISNLASTVSTVSGAYDSMYSSIQPLTESITNLHSVFSKSSTPNEQVQAELNKLLAESREWNEMVAEMEVLGQKKIELHEMLIDNFNNIAITTSDLGNNIVIIDGLRRDAFTGNSKRDLHAMLCLQKMEQKAKNRLLKYHYYVRKAYEYRLLEPYISDFNLPHMFERLETVGTVFDEETPINYEAYQTLGVIFKEEISNIIETILDKYNHNIPELSAPIYFTLTQEDIHALNNDENITLNMFERGFFSPTEENIRIVDFSIYHIESHIEGNIGISGYFNINFEHSGISRLRKNGQIYWFNHISRETKNPHTWSIRVDALTNEISEIKPSFAQGSLLRSILGNDNNIMLYSRPAAWSDIIISKNVHSNTDARIVIDSVIIKLQYDYTPRPNNIRNIDIATSNNLLPFITSSVTDMYERGNGKGNFQRAFTASSQPVLYEAPETYGGWRFVNWTDRQQREVTNSRQLNITRSTDQYYIAQYEYYLPILSTVDTLYVNANGGQIQVDVRNEGMDDMTWLVSDSLSNWVGIIGNNEGINDGSFTLEYTENTSGNYRIDSISIEAPETEEYSKTIYIVQSSSVPPLVMTLSATSVTQNAVTLNGYLEEGNEDITEKGFKWKRSHDPTFNTSTSIGETFERPLINLELNTSYTYKAYAITVSGTVEGDEITFTTLDNNTPAPPLVATLACTETTHNSVLLNGAVTAQDEPILMKGFEWKKMHGSSYSIVNMTGTSNDVFSFELTDLDDNTPYMFRTFASTFSGNYYGVEKIFYTSGISGLETNKTTEKPFLIYPNPVEDFFKLTILDDDVKLKKLEIIDLRGRLLKVVMIHDSETMIDMQGVAPGLYLIRMSDISNKIISVGKIIKN